jgi:hypothetical protein
MAVDRAFACVSCHKENNESERANYGFTRLDNPFSIWIFEQIRRAA